MQRAIALPTRETLLFVARNLPCEQCSIVDVGCGEGEVAVELQLRGHRVVAVDRDDAAIESARQHGVVDARVLTWPEFDERDFDAVLFRRALHHIGADLDTAVARACEAVREGGRVIVEDFAYRDVDPRLIEWFAGVVRRLELDDGFLTDLADTKDPVDVWLTRRQEIASIGEMRDALARYLDIVSEEDAPYFYRYVPETFADHIFESERVRAKELGVPMLGRRIVAEKKKGSPGRLPLRTA